MIVSGWGDLEDYKEEMDKNLAHLLSKWDGKNTVILSKISKICRKVSYCIILGAGSFLW